MSESLGIMAALPEASLFNWPPVDHPAPLPPAHAASSTILHPFNIPDSWFTAALDARVPITIAAVYAITVKSLTAYNLSHGKKPWAISKTRLFFAFVVLHNIFLAVYSAWTFWGMLGGMRRSVFHPFGPAGFAGTADSFCKVHGAPGLGNAVFYDDVSASWVSLAQDGGSITGGVPSMTQPGRVWNEGLAYFGWLFYISKFYEVLDTFIILAKGKPSSTLQTYHHAGAMMCMWAGIRYMSTPIWVFVVFNSFIHSLMYTYYTVTAFSIKVPNLIKRTLTSMQITQFIFGASCAMVHSFITYTVPVTLNNGTATAPTASALPTVAGALDSIRQLVFGQQATGGAASASSKSAQTVHLTQPCITTAGETFAIWLNVLYLAPLTYLFVSFFIASYVKRSNAAGKIKGKADRRLSNNVALAEKAGWDAARDVEREVYGGENMLNGSAVDDAPAGKKKGGKAKKRS